MANPHPQLDKLIEQDPDLVDRIFEYILSEFPHIAGPDFDKAKRAVREEFRGEEVYIAARGPSDRHDLAVSVLSMFNGRNAREVARRLGIGRATVYRLIKQGGGEKRLSFPGNETRAPVRSPTETEQAEKQEPPPWPSQRKTSPRSTARSRAENSPSVTTDEQSPIDP